MGLSKNRVKKFARSKVIVLLNDFIKKISYLFLKLNKSRDGLEQKKLPLGDKLVVLFYFLY